MAISGGQIKAAASIIRARMGGIKPRVGLILGSGLGSFVDTVNNPQVISYADLPGFPDAGVGGHAGRLVMGSIGGTDVMVMQGRGHYYEAADANAMKVPVRTFKELGCETLLITNAAGSTVPDIGPGSMMLISDHINFTGISPLFGETGNQRFVDLTDAYDPAHRKALRVVADDLELTLHDGVYMWFCGPQFETPAEIRAASLMGATAIGMSTVPEVILARHSGLRVAVLSIITNLAAGMSAHKLSHDQTLENAEIAAINVRKILHGFLSSYQSQ